MVVKGCNDIDNCYIPTSQSIYEPKISQFSFIRLDLDHSLSDTMTNFSPGLQLSSSATNEHQNSVEFYFIHYYQLQQGQKLKNRKIW